MRKRTWELPGDWQFISSSYQELSRTETHGCRSNQHETLKSHRFNALDRDSAHCCSRSPMSDQTQRRRRRICVVIILLAALALILGLALGLSLKHKHKEANSQAQGPAKSPLPSLEPQPLSNSVLDGLSDDSPQTREYDFTIGEITGAPDGVSRTMLVVNGQSWVRQGSKNVLTVWNRFVSWTNYRGKSRWSARGTRAK